MPSALVTSLVALAVSITEFSGLFCAIRFPEHSHPLYLAVAARKLLIFSGALGAVGIAWRLVRDRAPHILRGGPKYHPLYEQAAVGILYIGDRDELLSYNQKFCDMLGYSREDLAGKTIGDITYLRDVEQPEPLFSRFLAGEAELLSVETPYLCKGGSIFWGNVTVSLLPAGKSPPARLLAVVQDISNCKRAEAERQAAEQQLQQLKQDLESRITERTKALEQSEARWQFALNGAGDGIWDWNVQTNFVFFSRQWKAMLGYSEDDIGDTLSEWDSRVHPDDKPQCYADIQRALRGETTSYRNEHRLRCKDGSYKWILDRGKVIEWCASGQPLRMIGTHSDISERKRLEANSKAAERQMQTIVEATAATTGQDFFSALVQYTAQALNVPYVVVTERIGDHLRTLAFWSDGSCQYGVVYRIANTPCEQVFRKGKFYCERQLHQRFTSDVDLLPADAESYLGVALCGSDGAVVGSLVVLDRQPLAELQRREDILRIFAARAVAELERQRAGLALERLNQDLEAKVKARTAELQEREQFLQTVLDTAPLCVFWKDRNSVYLGSNRRFLQDVNLSSAAELIGKIDYDLPWGVSEAEAYRTRDRQVVDSGIPLLGVENLRLRSDGSQQWLETSKLPLRNLKGEVIGVLGTYQDITARKQAELALQQSEARLQLMISDLKLTQQRIAHNALHDPLTGLPNRALIMERLEQAIARSQQIEGYHYAVLFIDLDRFKVINDSLGHATGDQLLIAIANRLSMAIPDNGCVARLGGDEFVILLEEIRTIEAVTQLVSSILADAQTPLTLSGQQVFTGVSIGVVMDRPTYQQPADLIRDADIAMYEAKAQGGNRYQLFDRAMHACVLRRLTLETDLHRAMEQGEFVVHYQPIVELANLQPVGFEALVRWRHPTGELILPDKFVPAAEEMGMITALDSWTFKAACKQMAYWQNTFAATAVWRISVNLSTQDLRRPSLVADIDAILSETGLAASAVTLEITESLLIDDIHRTVKILEQLALRGIRISIDDFGTGYSSLSYLHYLPINYLKIDSSFIERMEAHNHQYQIIDTIITLSDRLGLTTVAEGIEVIEQLQILQRLGCELGQGYLFSEAVTAHEVEARFLRIR